MKLVIVESPTKAKTIAKFLGSDFNIESSFGHIRDLPISKMGIDIEHDFEPKYVVPSKAKKNLKKLQELAKKSDKIVLATDEDREGEAIAWHLAEALKVDLKNTDRIVFHEITKSAIDEALKHPRKIDMKLVNAQQARRILDRLVGYELSPFLWKKVAKGLSAGRVQSVAVRLIVEREREIKKFNTQEYWSIEAILKNAKQLPFLARLNKVDN
ncbi:toprim domain-containing protein, partial [Patescibacteria group bacterium]|nr:toprim domain-containing protein [Patescibacteria group bacterium]